MKFMPIIKVEFMGIVNIINFKLAIIEFVLNLFIIIQMKNLKIIFRACFNYYPIFIKNMISVLDINIKLAYSLHFIEIILNL